MIPEPQPEALLETLEGYNRCVNAEAKEWNNIIHLRSGDTVAHSRFLKDLHGPTVDIIGHGYTITSAQRKTDYTQTGVDWEDRNEVSFVTLKPLQNLISESTFEWCKPYSDSNGIHRHVKGPRVRP